MSYKDTNPGVSPPGSYSTAFISDDIVIWENGSTPDTEFISLVRDSSCSDIHSIKHNGNELFEINTSEDGSEHRVWLICFILMSRKEGRGFLVECSQCNHSFSFKHILDPDTVVYRNGGYECFFCASSASEAPAD